MTIYSWAICGAEFLKLLSAIHEVRQAGIEFQRDAPAKKKLVLNWSVLGLGSIIARDGARLLWQIKRSLRYWGARFRNALKTSTVLFNISFSRSGSSPKRCSISSVVTDKSDIINFAALLWRELSLWNRICYSRPRQYMHRLGETKCEHNKIAFAWKCLRSVWAVTTGTGYFVWLFVFNCFACANNVGSPTKFIVYDNAKVSVLISLLYVIVFETKIQDKRAKLMFLPGGK